MTVFSQITDLVRAVIWPLAIVAVLVVYRKHIPGLVSAVGRRVSGVAFGGFSVAFTVASEPSPEVWNALKSFADPLAPESVPDSGSALFMLVNSGVRADSARFDLRTGRAWLTSRLYIFAVLLPAVLGVRCLVFTETRDGVARRFVGLAEPRAVATALGRHFNWFTLAWTRASIGLYTSDENALTELRALAQDPNVYDWQLASKVTEIAGQAMTPQDLLQPNIAESVAQQYLTDSRIRRERVKGSPAENGWVQLRETEAGNIREEHARWISSGADLDDLLGDIITRSHVVYASGTKARHLNRDAVLQGGQFVAVVDGDGRFQYLLHRGAVVEQLAIEAAERET